MSTFPEEPVSPREFMEDVIPSLFAEVALEPDEEALELRVGVVLEGEGGGEWTLHFAAGALGVRDTRDPDAELTVIQAVTDWRAAIWEGRPALVAEGVEQIRRGIPGELRPPSVAEGQSRLDPLKGISDLRGRIEMVIDDEGEGRWAVGVLMGPGAVPETPQAIITLGAAEAESIRTGALHPLEALISGQLQLDGDLGLILQLQAVAMTLSMAAGGRQSPRDP